MVKGLVSDHVAAHNRPNVGEDEWPTSPPVLVSRARLVERERRGDGDLVLSPLGVRR